MLPFVLRHHGRFVRPSVALAPRLAASCQLHSCPLTCEFAFAGARGNTSPVRGFASPAYWASQSEHSYTEAELRQWSDQFGLHKYDLQGLRLWRAAFDSFDNDCDGFISQADLQKHPAFSIEKANIISKYDRDRNNLLDFGEFIEALCAVDAEGLRGALHGFDAVDVQLEFDTYAIQDETKKRKVMALADVMRMMRSKDFTCVTEVDAQKLLDAMDTSKDGVVDVNEFRQWAQKTD